MEPLQLAIDGLALGAVYALVALGFVLVLNGIGAANLAHGDLVSAGGFLAVMFAGWLPSWPGLAFLPVVAVAMALIGFVLTGLLPVRPQRDASDSMAISTFAIGAIIVTGLTGVFGPTTVSGPPLLGGGSLSLLGLSFSRQSLIVTAAAAILIPCIHLLLNATQFGRRLRAAGQDPELARALGIDTRRMAAATLALGTSLAGIAGLLLADRFMVSPGYGFDLLVKAYVAVAIAGWGQVGGSAAIALAIGVFEALVAQFATPAVADGLIYLALLVMLAFQPHGLFGPAAQRRA
jgi:branched-chain amino acid transport system permease protein